MRKELKETAKDHTGKKEKKKRRREKSNGKNQWQTKDSYPEKYKNEAVENHEDISKNSIIYLMTITIIR